MSAPTVLAAPILRTAAGEPPLGRGAEFFLPEQGEILAHDNPRYRTPSTTIVVLALDGGAWLASPPSLHVSRPQYPSRDAALRAGIAALVRRARKYMRNAEGQGTQWTEGYAGRVIEWALSLKPATTSKAAKNITENIPGSGDVAEETGWAPAVASWCDTMTDQMAREELCIAGYQASDAGVELSDPVVRYLVEQHGLRKQFPAKHIFSMTRDVADGRIVSVATCACKQVLRFGSNDQLRMNAAIEAHWRQFDHEPKVDGRGEPIGKAANKARSRRAKAADAPDLLAAAGSSDGGGENQPEQRAGPHRASGETGSAGGEPSSHLGATGDSELTRSARAPSEADRLDWEGLWAVAWQTPIDDVVAADMVARGLVFAIDPHDRSRGYNPTKQGVARVDALKHLFDLDETRKKLLAKPAQICAGDEIPEPAEGCDPDQTVTGGALIPSMVAEQAGKLEAGETPVAGASAAVSPAWLAPGEPASVEGACGHAPPEFLIESDDLAIDWPSYDQFLEDKIVVAPLRGIEVPRDGLHPYLKPHCKDLTVWALRLGCAAIFASFGLHKTAMQLEWCRQLARHTGQPTLSVVPLGVRHGFIKEAQNLGMDVRFIRTTAELDELYCEGVRHFLTNYESIREGKLDPNAFESVSLDEASVLRSYGSKTFQEFLPLFAKVPFKLVATATPSPNRYKELIHYAGFLGVMDTGLALTRFFQRNSEKAGDLTLYPHKQDEFWMWVHSWAAFLQKPSELGHSDDGYELPPLKLRWHEVPTDHSKAEPERDGQGVMFRDVAVSLQDAAKARRDSLPARIAKMAEIIASAPDDHFLIWHDLEAEREAIEQALPGVVTISGSTPIDPREELLRAFEEGEIRYFATKPVLSGSGSNFQYHCHRAIYVALPGYGYKFNDFIQSLYRLQRFGQVNTVEVDIIYAEDERQGRAALEGKWALDTEMRARMSEIIRAHGLNTLPLRDALLRAIGVQRVEIAGKGWLAINNDAVVECQAWPEASVDLIVTSIPFGNQYEYSPSYNDFGHSDDSAHFWSQMDFLTCELARMLKPGRLACIHVKDRVLFGAVTGEGVPTISPFHAEAIMHYRAHGLQFMGMITVVTDVVRENNQTYRLGWTECAKDGTKMGVGCPEYVLLFRKRQSDRSRGYADVPVTKDKESYRRARWQLDAHAFWRSSGNRLLSTAEFAHLEAADHARLFAKISADRVYDYEAHVRIGEALERQGTLPATFMAIAPGSHHEAVWHDVNRMRTLNMLQQRKGAEMHLCPLQFDIVDRLIERFSNEGELVFDPFGGLMTVPYRALLKKRRGAATELSASYFMDGVHYLRLAEEQMAMPDLFDLMAFDKANAPPGDDMMEGAA
ncbi:DNA methyltransferase [Bradyrhizobium sp. HKCCYLR1023]|uniref:DNA methyltransferase n=1 Tax=Bradyrhizobium TaxID=374 RepID=UPI003EB76E69